MKRKRCPICHKHLDSPNPLESEYYPFCSKRCQMVDLGLWITEGYQIPDDENAKDEHVPDEEP